MTTVQFTSGRSRHSFNPICDVPGIDACIYSVIKKEGTVFSDCNEVTSWSTKEVI